MQTMLEDYELDFDEAEIGYEAGTGADPGLAALMARDAGADAEPGIAALMAGDAGADAGAATAVAPATEAPAAPPPAAPPVAELPMPSGAELAAQLEMEARRIEAQKADARGELVVIGEVGAAESTGGFARRLWQRLGLMVG